MLRELMALWRKTDPCKEMYDHLIQMVETGGWMLNAAWQCMADGVIAPETEAELYRRDITINKAERTVRKHVVEHLSVSPGVDMPACLVLMSVVKDAERIGDYCKNLLEAARLQAEPLGKGAFAETFAGISQRVLQAFAKTRAALTECDEALAQTIVEEEREVATACDALLKEITASSTPTPAAVPWALAARYLKRVSAHLGNIASSLVMPLHKLDYYDEDLLPGHASADGSQAAHE